MAVQGRKPFGPLLIALLIALALLSRPYAFVGPHSRRASLRTSRCAEGFQEKREALKACLAREYRSFFKPFEAEFYADDVSFTDPLNQLKGKESYKANVEMLSGNSLVGNILFTDAFIDLHGVEEVGDASRLRTRWTLGFAFKLLPWRPRALFSGVSEYTIDPQNAKVLSQRDYWDTLSLEEGGSYVPESPLSGLKDLVSQLLPAPLKPAEAREPLEASKWSLLRRASSYRVYRHEGEIFAVEAPGFSGGMAGVQRDMQAHGLVPGQRIRKGSLEAIELLEHPWKQMEPVMEAA